MAYSVRLEGTRSVSITSLDLGHLVVPLDTPMGGAILPVRAYLVEHPDGRILFDTGLGETHPEFDRRLNAGRLPLIDALAALGVGTEQIQCVVNCHLHYDHAGGNPVFAGKPIFVQTREYQARRTLDYVIPERIDFVGANLRLLNGDAVIVPGIRLIATPGHTPGHQSLVIEAESGVVVIAGQAAYTAAEFDDPQREPARGFKTASDPDAFLDSVERIRALNPQRVYFSHDSEFWEPRS